MARGGEVMGTAKGGALNKAPSSKPSMSRTTTATPKVKQQLGRSPAVQGVRRSPGMSNAGGDNQHVEELKGQIEQLNMDKEGQENENQTHVKEIMDVLYATEEGFAPPENAEPGEQ